MAGEWSLVLKATLSPVLRWLPGGVLRWRYPIPKCQECLTAVAPGVGPHIYINAERSPAIAGLNLTLMNRLPFPVKVDGIHLALRLEDSALTNGDQIVRMTIPAWGIQQIALNEIHLSEGQVGIVRKHKNESPILKVTGYITCESPVGEFTKNLQLDTRAFIYRGGER